MEISQAADRRLAATVTAVFGDAVPRLVAKEPKSVVSDAPLHESKQSIAVKLQRGPVRVHVSGADRKARPMEYRSSL